jgi:small subunit ribosomal protein S1
MENDEAVIQEAPSTGDLGEVKRKQHFTGTILKTTLAGAVVDIGLEMPGVVHISQLQVDPVNRVEDVVQPGATVDVWVQRVIPKKNRIELTMIPPLALEWREIETDMILKGKVTRLEKFGVFVDVGAERPGLVHISEMTHNYLKDPSEVVKSGDEIEVKVLSVDRQKRQIKLSMKALEEPPIKEVKENRPQKNSEPVVPVVEEEKEVVVPTAMEIALREAMDRTKGKPAGRAIQSGKNKKKSVDDDLENILSRTLKHKVKSK